MRALVAMTAAGVRRVGRLKVWFERGFAGYLVSTALPLDEAVSALMWHITVTDSVSAGAPVKMAFMICRIKAA